MEGERFFKEMYRDIWQSRDVAQFDRYYAKDFEETIKVSDEKGQPKELKMNYEELHRQAILQKERYRDTKIEIQKIVVTDSLYISVCFHSTSIEIQSGRLLHRLVSGIWRLNQEKKINRVWAVVTPYHSH